MKKLTLTFLFATLVGLISVSAQIDSSSLKKLNNKFDEVKQSVKKIEGFKKDVERYERLLKNKDITQKEFNDLIEGLCDLLNLNESPFILRGYKKNYNLLNAVEIPLNFYN